MNNGEKKRIFFDCNAFDYFYHRGIDPFKSLSKDKYVFVIIPQIKKEILEGNTPVAIKQWVQSLLDDGTLHEHKRFGFATYDNPNPEGVIGFSSYATYEQDEGSMLSYEQITKDGEGKAYLAKTPKKVKKQNDRLLATHAVHSIVLTCDLGDALGKAWTDGLQIVHLGKADPKEQPCVFDFFDGDLDAYIIHALSLQVKKSAGDI